MKLLNLFILAILSLPALAQESVALYDVKETKTRYNPVYLDVLPFTPKVNYINLPVTKVVSSCLNHETKYFYVRNIEKCGYDFVEKTICSGQFRDLPGVDYYTSRQLPSNNKVVRFLGKLIGGANYQPSPLSIRPRCKKIDVPQVRECEYSEKVCAETQLTKVTENRKIKLVIKNFPEKAFIKLGISEDEDLILQVFNIDPTCINRKVFKHNSMIIGVELKIKHSCYSFG